MKRALETIAIALAAMIGLTLLAITWGVRLITKR